ncbi:unnamed protein product [Cylindrotheca closterium]|uniref:Pre-mRNA-splicing factor 38 n=1 Tax=Cylindrotheca closterium TaxID=2856 RepID=A0AAD2JMF9_9STRA|nr:unnamed protein product [Cylindrotheca closterium]
MANVTDPLIAAVSGTDPQNLMEYITRQKIYDSRFWKEECFGLSAADVIEKATKSLVCIGGTYGGNHKPSKFLSLTLKLLQLQPDLELVLEFIQQDHFKYVKALGAFYLRLTGRPAEIYEHLEPLYSNFDKLRYRDVTEWKLVHMDEFVHDLFTKPIACGISMPRLPHRATLITEGYLEETSGPGGLRKTALDEKISEAGGIKEYLKHKMEVEQSEGAAVLWEKFFPDEVDTKKKKKKKKESQKDAGVEQSTEDGELEDSSSKPQHESSKRKHGDSKEDKKKKKKKPKYGSLFKSDKPKKDKNKSSAPQEIGSGGAGEGTDEYWNEQRAKLGLKPLNSS